MIAKKCLLGDATLLVCSLTQDAQCLESVRQSYKIVACAGPAAMAVPSGRLVPDGAAAPISDEIRPFDPIHEESRPPSITAQAPPPAGRPPLAPPQPQAAQPIAKQNGHVPNSTCTSPFQAVSMDRRTSWDVRDDLPAVGTGAGRRRNVPVDSMGNLQAPGANRQFSLELTTYASIPVRAECSGFRPPHRYIASAAFPGLCLTTSRTDIVRDCIQ